MLLAIVVLPLVVLALLPGHQVAAQETELIASGGELAQTSATSAPSTTAVPATTAAPRSTVAATVATTRAPATTAAPTPSTTAKPYVPATTPPTTAAPAAPAPAPAPVYVPPPAPTASGSDAAFLACVKRRESGGNYGAVSPGGTYRGAYQFYQGSWDNTARHAGRPDLVGVPPNLASPADQDAMALALLQWVGRSPWGGYCA